VAEAATESHRWQSAIDAMDSAWYMRRLSAEPRVVDVLGEPGTLVAYDTQTVGEQVDNFARRCEEVEAQGHGGPGDQCGALYAQPRPPASAVRRALHDHDFDYAEETAVVGDLTVVTALMRGSADGHEMGTFFIRAGKVIGTDTSSAERTHFGVTICSAVPGRLETAYTVGVTATGPDPSCPKGARTVHVRWRVLQTRAYAQDRIPGRCG
jgi:hypothetical protein